MSDKVLKGRIVQKHDTATNWAKATTFVPKAGELIIYDAEGSQTAPRFKVGDGITVVEDLPFVSGDDHPKLAMIRVRISVASQDWTDNTDGTVSVAIANSNITSQMSLLEWEPDNGHDFPTKGKYATTDGYLTLTLTDTPTTTVSGYFTLGVDSGSVEPGSIGSNVVTSVNGMTGDVTLTLPQGSTATVSDIGPFTTSAWYNGSTYYSFNANSSWLQAQCECSSSAFGDRFICTKAEGVQGPVYIIPIQEYLQFEIPPQTAIDQMAEPMELTVEGYLCKESEYQRGQAIVTKVEITSDCSKANPEELQYMGAESTGTVYLMKRGNIVTCTAEYYDEDGELDDASEIILATLPEGYRPPMTVWAQARTYRPNHLGSFMRIDTTGEVCINVGTSGGGVTYDQVCGTITYVVA